MASVSYLNVMGAGVLIKGETNRSPVVPIQVGKPLASQQQGVGEIYVFLSWLVLT